MARAEMKLEGVTLGNIAGGRLEEMFQSRMCDVAQVLAELDDWQVGKGGIVKTTITMQAEFEVDQEGHVLVTVGADLKLPKRRQASHGIYRQSGEWLTTDEYKQQPLFDPDRAKTTDEGEEIQ